MLRALTLLITSLLLVSGVAASVQAQHLEIRGVQGDEELKNGIPTAKAPAVIALLFFLVATLIHWLHFFRHQGRNRYMLSLTIGMTCMTLGFIIRAASGYSAWQFLLTFLSPVAFLAQNYVLLGRLAEALGADVSDDCLVFPRRGLVWTFLLSDIVTFACQTAGTVFVILGGKWNQLGTYLSVGGLALALVSYLGYTYILGVFIKRLRAKRPDIYRSPLSRRTSLGHFWATSRIHDVRLLTTLMALSCIGIIIRSIFRLIEQADGFFGYLATHEVYFYLFDALPLGLAMVLYALLWPPRVIEACREEGQGQQLGKPGETVGWSSSEEEQGWGRGREAQSGYEVQRGGGYA